MEHTKKEMSGSSSSSSSSSSSFTTDLFGPKDSSSSSSTGIFGSVFGPPSTGLGRDSSHSWPARRQEFGNQYANAKQGTSDYKTQRNPSETGDKHSKDRSSSYQNEAAEPCYFSSSIYYGGQEVYSPNSQAKNSQQTFKKDGGGNDSNGSNSNSASRGNWWQGSLYY